MRKTVTRLVLVSLGLASTALTSHIAFGEEANPVKPDAAKVEETTQSNAASDLFIGNGSALAVEQLGIEITPPTGWEVRRNSLGMSLVMEAPVNKNEKIDFSKPQFRRNITVTTMHEGSPIDEKEALRIKEKLVKDISQIGGIKNFQLHGDHKFFNYRGENDGLIIYSTFEMNDFPMMQMHVFVSGAKNRFLLTYTDLAANFEKDASFTEAWSSIVSIKVTGETPHRYRDLVLYGVPSIMGLLAIGGMLYARRRKGMREYAEADKDLYMDSEHSGNDDLSTHTGAWEFSAVEAPLSGSWEGLSQKEHSAVEELSSVSDNEVAEASGFGGLFAKVSKRASSQKEVRREKAPKSDAFALSGISSLSAF